MAGIGIPAAIIIASWLITGSIERAKNDTEYVKIALGILATDKGQAEPTSDVKALRGWAVRLLDEKSPIKFTKSEGAALLESGIPRNAVGAMLDSPFGPVRIDIQKHLKESEVSDRQKFFKFDEKTQF